ncbi:hypothetical protein MKX01_011038 [Papaver californicum]|nr:hypothetical protein MKX01_011038 [Papaver californicum]
MAPSDKDAPESIKFFDTPPSVPENPMSVGQHMLGKGAAILQTLKPIKMMQQHVCIFALYSHDESSDRNSSLCEEQKLWHSQAYEIKSGLWLNPRVPKMVPMTELGNLTKTYGNFCCIWQVDKKQLAYATSNVRSYRQRPPSPKAAPWLVFPHGKGRKFKVFIILVNPIIELAPSL